MSAGTWSPSVDDLKATLAALAATGFRYPSDEEILERIAKDGIDKVRSKLAAGRYTDHERNLAILLVEKHREREQAELNARQLKAAEDAAKAAIQQAKVAKLALWVSIASAVFSLGAVIATLALAL